MCSDDKEGKNVQALPADLSNNRTENLDRYKYRHYTKYKSSLQGFCLIMFFKKFVYNFCHIRKYSCNGIPSQ